LAALENNADYC